MPSIFEQTYISLPDSTYNLQKVIIVIHKLSEIE